ncbi:MAG: ABC transporter permease [Ruminococcus sp.]|nr:ABC transporter permease [Ruminococcus sp.]
MRYTLKNIKQFIKNNTLYFFLFLLSVFMSSLILLSAYVIYTEYHEKTYREINGAVGLYDESGSEMDEESPEYLLFQQPLDKYYENSMMLGECRGFFEEVGNALGDKLDYISFECYPRLYSAQELNDMEWNAPYITIYATQKNGEVVFPNIKNMVMTSGRIPTEYEALNGEAVCLAGIERMSIFDESDMKLTQEDGQYYVTTCGAKYKVVGRFNPLALGIAMAPQSAPDNCYVGSMFEIKLNDVPTVKEYAAYKSVVDKYFGDMITQSYEIPTVSVETEYFYTTNVWLSIIIILAAAVNLAALYESVLMSRRKTFAIFRLNGASKLKICEMCLAETAGISAIVFILAAVVFKFLVMPVLSDYYPYAVSVISLKTYISMFLIYLAVTIIIIFVLVLRYLSKTPVTLLKGGESK